jgi:hypothetical protein
VCTASVCATESQAPQRSLRGDAHDEGGGDVWDVSHAPRVLRRGQAYTSLSSASTAQTNEKRTLADKGVHARCKAWVGGWAWRGALVASRLGRTALVLRHAMFHTGAIEPCGQGLRQGFKLAVTLVSGDVRVGDPTHATSRALSLTPLSTTRLVKEGKDDPVSQADDNMDGADVRHARGQQVHQRGAEGSDGIGWHSRALFVRARRCNQERQGRGHTVLAANEEGEREQRQQG